MPKRTRDITLNSDRIDGTQVSRTMELCGRLVKSPLFSPQLRTRRIQGGGVARENDRTSARIYLVETSSVLQIMQLYCN